MIERRERLGGFMKKLVLILMGVSCLGNTFANSAEVLTKKLIDLRSEVEELNQKLDSKKLDLSNEYKALSSRRNQLEAEIEAAEVKKKLSTDRLVVIKKELSKETIDKDLIGPSLNNIFESLASYIDQSLPFQTSKRMNELNKIKNDFHSGVLPAPKAVSRLWTFVEDELRLTRENGIHKYVISLNGEEKLATIAKLGMMSLYFQSGEFEYGMATKTKNGFEFVLENNKERKKEIVALIDGLKKQIRVGRYSVPNTKTSEEIKL